MLVKAEGFHSVEDIVSVRTFMATWVCMNKTKFAAAEPAIQLLFNGHSGCYVTDYDLPCL